MIEKEDIPHLHAPIQVVEVANGLIGKRRENTGIGEGFGDISQGLYKRDQNHKLELQER